ncbi:MAG TPA: histidine--tRNA ligase [Patescibacteria group bacterium]|nr:histidine--tRNA ligase [Patescibacteria group bacterium]
MSNQPQVLKGFRDFLPKEKRARDFVMGKITNTFKKFGFEPIETPTIEYRETIMGKYGDEADKLVYSFEDNGKRAVALRYDQTVPTARFIANHFNDLAFPFRRYQNQNVFRADKPQKGRYREFTQCDIDIFGSTDPLADAEIIACTYAAYKAIGFKQIKMVINDRQVLMGALQPFANSSVNVFSIIQSIDKLDKLPVAEVIGELVRKGMGNGEAGQAIEAIQKAKPSENLQKILDLLSSLGVARDEFRFDPLIARGLDYYTGMIFEIRIPGFTAGSVGGGGRYDNLIEQLCGLKMPAVGVAFGFDRTLEAAVQFNLIEDKVQSDSILVTVFDESLVSESAVLAAKLRKDGMICELYPKVDKLVKQFKYADKKGFRYCAIIGPDEVKKGIYLRKDLQTGEQKTIGI